jgi:signal transduction histidine kinase/ligand-binding sensor domain-containing protein
MYKKPILFIFFISLYFAVLAQSEHMRFQSFQTRDGLAGSRITGIYLDNIGYLWIGTNDGLNKYDGNSFTTYRHNQSNSITLGDNYIKAIFEDNQKNLWICTHTDIAHYDRKKDAFIPLGLKNRDKELKNLAITNGLVDKAGNIWLTTRGNGLIKILHGTKAIEKFTYDLKNPSGIPSNFLWSIIKDTGGKIWVGADSGLVCFQPEKPGIPHFDKVQFKGHDLKAVALLGKDNSGKIWAGCLEIGLYAINPTDKSFKFYNAQNSSLSSQTPYSFLQDKHGNIWVGTFSGLNLLAPNSDKFVHLYHNPNRLGSLSHNSVWSIFQDRSGVLWFGTSNGLNKYDKHIEKFGHFETISGNKNSLINNYVHTFCEESEGIVWIGTSNGLQRFNSQLKTFENIQFSKKPSAFTYDIRSLSMDKNGNLWIGTWGDGVYKYQLKTGATKHFERIRGDSGTIPGNYVRKIYIDKTGKIWIGTTEGLVEMEPETEKLRSYLPDPSDSTSISGRDVFHLFEDSRGNFWVGTLSSGLNKMDRKSGKFEQFQDKETDKHHISSNSIRCITESGDGTLWVGTRNGLNKFDYGKRQFTSINTNNGLPNDAILGIVDDGMENLWISTNDGLAKFTYKTGKIKNYYEKDGLQNNEFNSNAYLKTSWGEILFGGPNGFNIFKPDHIRPKTFVPNVVLTDLKVFNVPVKIGETINGNTILSESIAGIDKIELSYKNNVFSIDFSALDFTAPQFVQYAYKLEGFDKDWINTSANRRFVTYTNLDGGTYVFKVKSSNSCGVWNEHVKTLTIVVHPPFWYTWWFFLLSLTSIIALVVFMIRARIKAIENQKNILEKLVQERTSEIKVQNEQLKVLNATKDKFFRIIAHDLRNPFSGILGFSDLLTHSVETNDREETLLYVRNIQHSAASAFKLLENLLDWSRSQTGVLEFNPESFKLFDIVNEIVELSEANSRTKNIQISSNISESLSVFADRNMLSTVLRNLLSNAVKYTPRNGLVEIAAKKLDKQVIVSVSDNGVGIKSSEIEKLFDISQKNSTLGTDHEKGSGLGLILCKEFIEKHGGKIWAESVSGSGSKFNFSIPTNGK